MGIKVNWVFHNITRSVRVIKSSRKEPFESTWSEFERSHAHSRDGKRSISYSSEINRINLRNLHRPNRTRINKSIQRSKETRETQTGRDDYNRRVTYILKYRFREFNYWPLLSCVFLYLHTYVKIYSTPGTQCIYKDSTLWALVYNTYISETVETLKFSYLPNPILDYDGDFLPLYEHHEHYIECKPSPNLIGILLVKRYTNVKYLTFKFCGWVTKEVVNKIAENLSQLEYLDLRMWEALSSWALTLIYRNRMLNKKKYKKRKIKDY